MDSDVFWKGALIIVGMILTVIGMGVAVFFGISLMTSGSLFGGVLFPLILTI